MNNTKEDLLSKIKEGFIPNIELFYGSDNPLSNNYESQFHTYGWVSFASSEQCFMYNKARLFNDRESTRQLDNLYLSPTKANTIGRRITGFDPIVWEKEKYHLMKEALYQKFSNCPHLKWFLLNTGDKILVNANAKDRVWGAGVSKNHAHDVQQWTGDNLLGFSLMDVRDHLRNEKTETTFMKYDAESLCTALILYKIKPEIETFYGKENPLSNNYPVEFTNDEHVTFSCIEQYMMYRKAKAFKDGLSVAILSNPHLTPDDYTNIGQLIIGHPPYWWSIYSTDIMKDFLTLKFSKSKILKEKLLETGNAILVSANPTDQYWSAGVESPLANNPKKWTGKNLLGFALMEVREQLALIK